MFPKKVKKYFNIAQKAAKRSKNHYRHGAVLGRGGVVFSVVNNDSRFCSFGERFGKKNKHPSTLHAELGVILGISRDKTKNSDVYVVRIGKNGELRNSRPCLMCQSACKYVGIRRIFYSVCENEFGIMRL